MKLTDWVGSVSTTVSTFAVEGPMSEHSRLLKIAAGGSLKPRAKGLSQQALQDLFGVTGAGDGSDDNVRVDDVDEEEDQTKLKRLRHRTVREMSVSRAQGGRDCICTHLSSCRSNMRRRRRCKRFRV